jgi:hypothetical protein
MAETAAGTIVWTDLTVDDAEKVRDFYAGVVGWRPEPCAMGGYDDYVMCPPGAARGAGAAGVCHARGENVGLPAQWLVYVAVPDLAASIRRCEELGGAVVHGPRNMGKQPFCVVSDPAGAVLALIQAA